MPRTYKRKTDRASTPLVELDRAVKEVQPDHASGGKGDEDLQDDLEKIHGEEKHRRSNKDRA